MPRNRKSANQRKSRVHPSRTIIFSFLGVIVLGWILLSLPQASREAPLSLVDSLFTATSATCVTGLIVVDTGSRFTAFGQVVILALVQLGGLGIMTFSSFFLIVMGRRLSIKHRLVIQQSLSQVPRKDMFRLVKYVLGLTLLSEALGALLLYWRFIRIYPSHQAVYHAIFHSVSAFCNAGFSLYRTSFVGFQDDIWVNLVMIGLIVFGGLGFFALADVNVFGRLAGSRSVRRLSLHTKIVFTVTVILIVTGTLLVLLLEWQNTLADKCFGVKLLASFFQSVTARTAGFNTLLTDRLTNASLLLVIILMFIGASPGSTGGGIKTSTFGILIALMLARLKGRRNVELFHRTIPLAIVATAISVAALALITVALVTMILSVTEGGLGSDRAGRGKFLELLFETTSAFGTVGLSTGVTPNLTTLGKILISITIFVGRVGPLTLALAVGQRQIGRSFEYPEENVMVG
ncbi:TrkH family potassium uptake protein [Candidatus Zixiibacteriota bacterium]